MQYGNLCPRALLKKQRIEILHVLAVDQIYFLPSLHPQTPRVIIICFVPKSCAEHLDKFVTNLFLQIRALKMQLRR